MRQTINSALAVAALVAAYAEYGFVTSPHPPPCGPTQPDLSNFPSSLSPVMMSGTVKLGGDVDFGTADIASKYTVTKPGSPNTILFDRTGFQFNDLFMVKDQVCYNRYQISVQNNCRNCEIVSTYQTPRPPPDSPKVCPKAFDQVYLVDSSESQTQGVFENQIIPLVQDLTHRFKIQPNKTRLAVSAFSTSFYYQFGLLSPEGQNGNAARQAIGNLNYLGGLSNFTAPIDSVSPLIYTDGRNNVPNSVVLIADGRPNVAVSQLQAAVEQLRQLPNLCFAIIGTNVPEQSEDEIVLRAIVGCGPTGPCPAYERAQTDDPYQSSEALNRISDFMCACNRTATTTVAPTFVTCATLKIKETLLPQIGTPSEVQDFLYRTIFDIADELQISPLRVSTIDIRDTKGNDLDDIISGGGSGSARRLQTANFDQDDAKNHSYVELAVQEPDEHQQGEPSAQDVVKALKSQLNNSNSNLARRLSSFMPQEVTVERLATRSVEPNMPIMNVIHH